MTWHEVNGDLDGHPGGQPLMGQTRTVSFRKGTEDLLNRVDEMVQESKGGLSFSSIVEQGLRMYLMEAGRAD